MKNRDEMVNDLLERAKKKKKHFDAFDRSRRLRMSCRIGGSVDMAQQNKRHHDSGNGTDKNRARSRDRAEQLRTDNIS